MRRSADSNRQVDESQRAPIAKRHQKAPLVDVSPFTSPQPLGGEAAMRVQAYLEAFNKKISAYLNKKEVDAVLDAYYYAEAAHEGQSRRTGDPYILHPLAVADILADLHMDHQTLAAALLHDVIEDTSVAKYTLVEAFGTEIAHLVDGVSKLATIFNSRAEAQAKNFQKMAIATAKDIRIILIKFADRLHNMRTLHVMPQEKRYRIAKETLDFYAPIAGRLGMDDMRVMLEDLSFRSLYPMRSSCLEKAVENARGPDWKGSIEKISKRIKQALKESGIEAKVFGRAKHLYSIYNKMKTQKTAFKALTDVLAFRILVEDVPTCYGAVGVVHNLYRPMPGTFNDYIAMPKNNGYQSIHTCLMAPGNVLPIEIQIRTHSMEEVATNGIAGHWLYKYGDQSSAGTQARVRAWVRDLLTLQRRTNSPIEFIDHLREDLFQNEIYVFSPQGEILELPRDATPVDYAYAISTQLGYNCVGCRVDRQPAPLSTPLKNGQLVEIIRTENATPKTEWLSFVVTGRARSAIRYALRHLRRDDAIAFGRELLCASLRDLGFELEDIPKATLETALAKLSLERLDALLHQIGIGDYLPHLAACHIAGCIDSKFSISDETISLERAGPVTIRGTEGVVVAYARCCNPIPGDVIVGHVQKNAGISIHVETCKSTAKLRQNRSHIYPVQWAAQTKGEFRAVLYVHSLRQKATIAEMAAAVIRTGATLSEIRAQEQDVGIATTEIILGVLNRDQLAQVIRKLRQIKDVVHINRPK